ncbi:MAG: glycerol kinase GlpK [Cyanobacteria bacterium REEB65]|nr:glycerol kinase GlpK [Cyanobacteria bacterium REEB65]
MGNRVVLAIDQGTTGTTVLALDQAGSVRGRAYREIAQYYPKPGWVEHDALEIWKGTLEAIAEAKTEAAVSGAEVVAIGITNQRETVVIWDRASGDPIARAIVWQCRRTAETCDRLRERGHEPTFRQKTGLVLDAYFSGTKAAWLLDNVPGARQRADRGELAMGTMDTWLIWKLTGGRSHVTDPSNASRTLLFDIQRLAWDDELCHLLNVPSSLLPVIVPNAGDLGLTQAVGPLPAGIPIGGSAGDQQAALFGQACFNPGQAKNTYGTGCFLLANTGDRPVASAHNLLATVAWQLGSQPVYALEGSVFVAGAAIGWLRDGLGIIAHAAQTEELARSLPDNGGVYLVPAFVGLGAPYWDPYARGAILGLTRGSTRAHLARAALEAIAFQTDDLLEGMADDLGSPLTALKVDGGAAANDFLLQFQADISDLPLVRNALVESTARGAAWLAGLGVGFWPGLESLPQSAGSTTFQPQMTQDERQRLLAQWHRAVERSRSWASATGGS